MSNQQTRPELPSPDSGSVTAARTAPEPGGAQTPPLAEAAREARPGAGFLFIDQTRGPWFLHTESARERRAPGSGQGLRTIRRELPRRGDAARLPHGEEETPAAPPSVTRPGCRWLGPESARRTRRALVPPGVGGRGRQGPWGPSQRGPRKTSGGSTGTGGPAAGQLGRGRGTTGRGEARPRLCRGRHTPAVPAPGAPLSATGGRRQGSESTDRVRAAWASPCAAAASGQVERHQHVDDPAGGREHPEEQAEEHQRAGLAGRLLRLRQVPPAQGRAGLQRDGGGCGHRAPRSPRPARSTGALTRLRSAAATEATATRPWAPATGPAPEPQPGPPSPRLQRRKQRLSRGHAASGGARAHGRPGGVLPSPLRAVPRVALTPPPRSRTEVA